MGKFMDWLMGADLQPNATATTVQLPPVSGDVVQVAHLPSEVAEAFGINTLFEKVTRDEAMTIPSVRRGRQIIAGTLGATPLVCTRVRAGQPPERVTRSLFTQPDPSLTYSYTMTQTIDDLIFYGVSWWRVLAFDSQGFPSQARRVSPEKVRVNFAEGKVYIDNEYVPDRMLIRFDGPDEGILAYGARALRTAFLLESAVRKYAKMDIPLGYFQDEDGNLTQDEIQAFLDAYELARAKRTTGYVPKGLKYENPSFNAEQVQLGEARGFQAQEIARLMNLPASYINAPTNDSLTYSTTESNRRELVDMTFAPYIAAVEQRLSMPDVTPIGTTVAFDLGKFLRGDISSIIKTGKEAVDSGLMTIDEVRTEWLGLPALPKEIQDDQAN